MTGTEIKRIREKLGLDHQAFAKFLCVHPSTVYRWELQAMPTLSGYTPAILQKLARGKLTPMLGDLLRRAVARHGALAGLSVLLERRR